MAELITTLDDKRWPQIATWRRDAGCIASEHLVWNSLKASLAREAALREQLIVAGKQVELLEDPRGR